MVCKSTVFIKNKSVLPLLQKAVNVLLYTFAHFFARTSGVQKSAEKATAARESRNLIAEKALNLYGNNILRLAYSYLHNISDAEDVLQDTLFRLIKTKPYLENSAHEKAWLLRVAANISKNRIDYNRIRDTDELNEELAEQKREDLSFVWEAVKELPTKYREAIHLFYYDGYSTAQIAEILGEKEITIRSHLNRGRAKLKEMLKEAYDFE